VKGGFALEDQKKNKTTQKGTKKKQGKAIAGITFRAHSRRTPIKKKRGGALIPWEKTGQKRKGGKSSASLKGTVEKMTG